MPGPSPLGGGDAIRARVPAVLEVYAETRAEVLEGGKRELLNTCPNDWPAIAALLDSRRPS